MEENLRRVERRQAARAIDEPEFERLALAEEKRALYGPGLGMPFDISGPPAQLVSRLLEMAGDRSTDRHDCHPPPRAL
jgi:hypothetical protein